jgi:hypothetical protein
MGDREKRKEKKNEILQRLFCGYFKVRCETCPLFPDYEWVNITNTPEG